MTYPPAPTTFDDLMQLIPSRGTIAKHRFVVTERPFELQISRNSMNIVWLEFCAPDGRNQFWPCGRRIESVTV